MNLLTLLQDVAIGEEIATQIEVDDAEFKANQPVDATIPSVYIEGHPYKVEIVCTPINPTAQATS